MASVVVLGAAALIALASLRISRARRRARRVGWMPVLLIVVAVALIVFVALPPLLAR